MAGLITGLVLYSKEKYTIGAEIVQWSALGNIIVTFANVIITCIITGVFAIETKQLLILLIGIIVSIILIVEALKVIRLTEQPGHVNRVTVPAIIIIAVVVIINIITTVQAKQELDDILNGIKDQINNEVVNKEDNEEANKDNDDNQGEINNEDKEEINKDEDDNQDENNNEEVVDPYANYKKHVWNTSTKVDTTVGNIIEIKSGKLYSTDTTNGNKITQITGMVGTPKKLKFAILGGAAAVYVLTDKGIIYLVDGGGIIEKTADLSQYNVIDMTIIDNHGQEYNYYLTADGKLIDKNGVSYSESKFVDSFSLNVATKISIDKNFVGFRYDGKTYNEIQDKTTGKPIKISKIYAVNSFGLAIIISQENKVYEYDGASNKATQIQGEVSSVKKIVDGEKIDLLITFKDGSTKLVERADYAYDVKNKKEITLASLATFDPYANYKKHVWNTSTKVDTTVGNIIEIKSGKLYSTDTTNGNKTTQITGIVGTPKKLKFATLGGAAAVYVLTDKGIIYLVDGGGIIEKTADLSQYNVIDMTIIDNHGQEYNYYLMADGKLIDKNGVSYSESRFTDSFKLNVVTKISIDKNFVGFRYDGKSYSEIQDKTTGKGVKISKIYPVKSYDVAIIISQDDKAYEYDGESNKATLIGELNTVERSEDVDNRLILKVKLKDGTDKWYENCAEEGYDVVNKQNIDINKLKRAEPVG